MKNKKKVIIIIISIVILLLIIGIVASQIKKKNKIYNSIDDFDSVKELVEYYKCDYKKMENSKEEGFSKDIYLKFMRDPIDEEGNLAQMSYEGLLKMINKKIEYINYRVIDESRNLIVRVMFDENKNGYYTVNNINNYFENLYSLYTINNKKEDLLKNVNITSPELQNIIENNWIRKRVNLGNRTSICNNYDIYWNEGYKIRTINNKIYNIIFLKNYKREIIKGITVGMTTAEIENVLGTPTYENDLEIEIIGYKLENLYIFFSGEEISVYRTNEYDEESNKRFIEIFNRLNKDGNYNSFISNLTQIYPDYSNYTQEENYIRITYPLRGFEIQFGQNHNNGITIYNNYQGNITENISIDDIKKDKKIPANTYLKLNSNFVFEEEFNRASDELYKRAPFSTNELEKGQFAQSNEYTTYYDETYNEYTFYSINKDKTDFTIRVKDATGIYNLTNNLFVYGVTNDGIYIIDAYTMKTNKIADSKKECIIDKVENNTIYYDDTSVQLSYN